MASKVGLNAAGDRDLQAEMELVGVAEENVAMYWEQATKSRQEREALQMEARADNTTGASPGRARAPSCSCCHTALKTVVGAAPVRAGRSVVKAAASIPLPGPVPGSTSAVRSTAGLVPGSTSAGPVSTLPGPVSVAPSLQRASACRLASSPWLEFGGGDLCRWLRELL